MKIGQAANAAGVNVETVRYYERRGLIARPPKPTTGGFRQYAPSTVRCIRFVKDAQKIGFSLAEISELLSLRVQPGATCREVRSLAEQRRAEVQERLNDLQRIADVLDELIDTCPDKESLGACSILEAIEREA
ncbi:MerR family transcriptional regulator [Roseivivax sp. GX 12232]|uniref:MerR family transcriptional regulator n=1 Tax=Roseivivax sp. GX 12232 TaxID=2900547 RepID=UPI001E43ECA4|nr:MerR family transcriptional regulator [Roseivivax sp. GX 12232]MCE0507328.1 MerR family transcriptional regulator [Roseivivax sp. GX 12232]